MCITGIKDEKTMEDEINDANWTPRIAVIIFVIVIVAGGYWWINQNQGLSKEELYVMSEAALSTIQVHGLRTGGLTYLENMMEDARVIYLNFSIFNPSDVKITIDPFHELSVFNSDPYDMSEVGSLYEERLILEPGVVNTFELEGYSREGTENNTLTYSLKEGLDYYIHGMLSCRCPDELETIMICISTDRSGEILLELDD
jgi:hypothetical protein